MNRNERTSWLAIQVLRKERKAALRECGRLGEKLHNARLEIESLRHRIKELESKLREESFSRGGPTESLRQRVKELEDRLHLEAVSRGQVAP